MEKRCARIPARKLVRSCKWVIYVLALLLGSMYLSYVVVYDEMTWHISKMIDRDPCSYSCEDSPMALDALRHISAGDPPYAYIVGSDQGSKVINPGECVCVRAVIPPLPLVSSNVTVHRQIPGYPADAMMIDLVLQSSKDELGREDPLYRDSRVTVSINMMRPMVDDRNANEVHVYEGTVRLYDPGLYEVDARLEQRNGEWNAEPGQPTVDFSETKMRTMVPGNEYVRSQVQVLRDTKHPTYLKRHQNLPLCTQGDEAGRWVPEENLPKSWRPWQYAMPAEDGRVWLPYHCRLRRISHAEFVFHMSLRHSSVHWYGDSNSRRSIRPFMLGGKWCHENSTWTRLDCLCNDAPKDLFPDEWYTSMPVPHWYRIHTHGANGSEVFADLSKQPLRPTDKRPILPKDPIDDGYYGPDYMPPGYANRNDYFDLYYLFTRGTLDMYGSYWDRDITEHNITRYRPADIVVFQLITWDVAFGDYQTFITEMPRLIHRLKRVYPNAKFIYRSGPYWCCRAAEDQDKKYSRLRFLAFDRRARRLFKRYLGAKVWDVMSAPSHRPPEVKRLDENMPCLSAHSRAEIIHLDNQLFMNMLVNDS